MVTAVNWKALMVNRNYYSPYCSVHQILTKHKNFGCRYRNIALDLTC